jgi:uncharacterized membrane protein
VRVRAWARRIPWHNYFFGGYYLFFGFMGLCAAVWTPSSIEGAAGAIVTTVWSIAAILVAVVGLLGALKPNYRWEVYANYAGILAVFAYASTVQLIVLTQDQPTRSAQFWAIAAHAWIFALRLVFIHRQVRQRVAQIEAE